MIKIDNGITIAELAQRELLNDLKRNVADIIIAQQMREFEDKLRSRVVEELGNVTLGKVEQIKDVLEMAEKMYVKIDIAGEIKEEVL